MVPTGLIELKWSYSQQIVKGTGNSKNLTFTHVELLLKRNCRASNYCWVFILRPYVKYGRQK